MSTYHRIKPAVVHEVDSGPNCNWRVWSGPQMFDKWVLMSWKSEDESRPSKLQIGLSPRDLMKLSLSQTPMNDYQLTQVWKARKE